MSIRYDMVKQVFELNTKNTSYQMKVDCYGVLLHLYYGGRILGNAEHIITYVDRGWSGTIADAGGNRNYTLDSLPLEYSGVGTGDFRTGTILLENADGTDSCDLRYVSHQITKGKYQLEGLPAVYASEDEAETLSIVLQDSCTNVQVELLYGVLPDEDIITRSVKIRNLGSGTVIIKKAASACLDILYGTYDLISFYGTHAMERQFQRGEITHGTHVIGSKRGVSGHQYNPAVILAEKDTTEDAGGCYGLVFAYSGNFMFEAEHDQNGQTRAVMGLQSERFSYPLEAGEIFTVPETILTYSEQGLTTLSQRYHHCMMHHLCRGKHVHEVRPVLINSWEAAYFDFDGEKIYCLAEEAKKLGIDMVVLDDGWFGHRNDDKTSLGDWYVNEEKFGCTLGELVERIHSIGMKFGLWIEPEMISEDSELYREHPDWALQIPGRKPVRARDQLVLDFSRKDIRDNIFEQICSVLDQANVEYVKWDMNRALIDLYSTERVNGKLLYDYVLGVYDFAERLMKRYPELLIEGCCSGGGRFDAGMLYYAPQIWCSDNTDAIDRIRIQYGTSFFYPIPTMGAHVSAVPNHQTGRMTSLHTRGIVAMEGTFGYELNPATLSDAEKEEIKEQITVFKKYAALIRDGQYYRLSNPFQDTCAVWQFVSEDKKEVLVNVVILEVHKIKEVNYIRLKGLDPEAEYCDSRTGNRYFGSALMKAGMVVPEMRGDNPACQIYLQIMACD